MSDNAEIPLLDGKHYALDGEELAFFKSQTGIQDEHALKAHIMKVQTEAYKVGDYCSSRRTRDREMRAARFIDIVVYFASTLSSAFVSSATAAYDQLLKLGQERDGAIFMDIGCCCQWCIVTA